jgi:hypothetical protein
MHEKMPDLLSVYLQYVVKGAQVWDFDLLDFNDFLSWSLYK